MGQQEGSSEDRNRCNWYAIQVRAQRENRVGDHLAYRGYEGFIPQQAVVRRYGKRVKKSTQVLFPGYVFCRFNPSRRLPILTIPGVLHLVGTSSGPLPIEEEVIRGMKRIMASKLPSEPWPYLKVGDKVGIIDGPLTGVEGFLLSFQGQSRLVLSVSLLQRSVAVEVDRSWIKPLKLSRKEPEQAGKQESLAS